jgi:hypothetical protein
MWAPPPSLRAPGSLLAQGSRGPGSSWLQILVRRQRREQKTLGDFKFVVFIQAHRRLAHGGPLLGMRLGMASPLRRVRR